MNNADVIVGRNGKTANVIKTEDFLLVKMTKEIVISETKDETITLLGNKMAYGKNMDYLLSSIEAAQREGYEIAQTEPDTA